MDGFKGTINKVRFTALYVVLLKVNCGVKYAWYQNGKWCWLFCVLLRPLLSFMVHKWLLRSSCIVLHVCDGFVMTSVYSEPYGVAILLPLLVRLLRLSLLNSALQFSRGRRTNAFNMMNVKRTLFCLSWTLNEDLNGTWTTVCQQFSSCF